MADTLPTGMGTTAKPGFRYSPDRGQHAGHVVEFQGTSVGHIDCDCGAAHYPAALVRCLDCLQSWTFAP